MRTPINFTTRRARPHDLDALDILFTCNMKQYVEAHCCWDPHMFRENFDAATVSVIEVNGALAGFIKLVYHGDEIYLAEIQLDKKYRNRGVGTELIRRVIDESEKSGRIITLKVIKGNPAEYFYKRLGFSVYEKTLMHLKMSRVPK